MCGIFALMNNFDTFSSDFIMKQFEKGKNRGPESSKLQNIYLKLLFGFHRLAINGINDISNQPIIINNIALICNGEIYNFRELYRLMNIDPKTGSDCEVIIYLYEKYGIEQTLELMEGVFAFVLCDFRNLQTNVYVARDPYGVRPLYYLSNSTKDNANNTDMVSNQNKIYGFASELKVLNEFCNENNTFTVTQFTPGTYAHFYLAEQAITYWDLVNLNIKYHKPSFSYSTITNNYIDKNEFNEYIYGIQKYLKKSILKRYLTTDRPIACLLSGGLDSSLITALICDHHSRFSNEPLETYSIGLSGSEDLKYARFVANYLGTKHTEIIVTEEEMFNAIPEVIYAIESYDTTTVRASIGNYLLGKYISKNSDAKVIFNGDGSDELCGGYLYMSNCKDPLEFDKETRRLLKDIHLFDVLRSDKSISSHGLEPRTPFLDKSFVNYYLSIPASIRCHTFINRCEKFLLRTSFSYDYYKDINKRQILPDDVLWRRKEAFSDGVSGKGPSFYQILQKMIAEKLNNDINFFVKDSDFPKNNLYKENIETEKFYYKSIFDSYYPKMSNILPYFWLPKYSVNVTDPSARTLNIYNKNNKELSSEEL